MLLGQMLREAARKSPDKVALRFGEQRWTYAALDGATDRLAASLAGAGVKTGDRVGLFMPNCGELLLSYFACFKFGAIAVPLNYRYRRAEAGYALSHSGATALLAHASLVGEVAGLPLDAMGVSRRYLAGEGAHPAFAPFAELLAGPPDPPAASFGEDQPAAILYTSGTTAKPKGVVHTHSTLWNNCLIQTKAFAFTADDVHLVMTAACHAAALTGQLLPNVLAGGASVLAHLPTPEQFVRLMGAHEVTRTQSLPAVLTDIVEYLEQHPEVKLPRWNACTAGGDVVPLDLHHRFRKVAGFDVTELWGMTEPLTAITNPPYGPKRPGSIGKPADGYLVRLADDEGRDVPDGQMGELLVKGPAVTVGYWNDAAATAEALRDGWLHTGDFVRRDAEGYYWFVGRKKEIIIRGGSNVSPLEVEEVIDEHPAVHLSCVVGIPDRRLGEVVAAFVALKHDTPQRPTPDELRHFVAGRIAAYKVPERIFLVDDLPLNATGKVDRKRLHARVLSGSGVS